MAPSAGYLDGVACSVINGWAWNSTQPNTPINVDLYDSTTPIATVTANQFRSDLLAAGIGNGYHGFNLTTPAYLKDGRTHYIFAYVSGTQIQLGFSNPSAGYQYYYTDALTSIN